MARQRILKEAQQLASKYSFWMVSGDINHLYGRVYETKDTKYEIEIKFNKDFPKKAPTLIFHEKLTDLLGDIQLKTVKEWNSNSKIISIIDELSSKIKEKLNVEDKSTQPSPQLESETKNDVSEPTEIQSHEKSEGEEYITPDLNAYPPEVQKSNVSQNLETADDFFYNSSQSSSDFITPDNVSLTESETQQFSQSDLQRNIAENTVAINTELALLQNEYAFDQKGSNPAELIVYLTLTLTKTFIITIDFSNYPKRPVISFPTNLQKMMGDPYTSIKILKSWNEKKPAHIVEIFRELETKLFSIKDVEKQVQKIIQEYRYEPVPGSLTKFRVHLLTYGFNEYYLDLDLQAHPDPPIVDLGPQLAEIIKIPVKKLMTIDEWEKGNSEPVEVIREISWLLDKNSRIDFEIQLLREHYENIEFDPPEEIITLKMKGKMKTENLIFDFRINIPRDYPMSVPEIEVTNEFDIESQDKIKNNLQASFKDFFDEWTPYSYLIDLFNLISKKIFEVSVVSCVICHKIDCPTCSLKIAGSDEPTCFVECPHCNRSYHQHCWTQTIKSFGKCGFCLKPPPSNMV